MDCQIDTASTPEGKFRLDLDLSEETIFVFKSTHGKFKFYLKPGDSLKRTFQKVTDADLFLIDAPGAGTFQVAAYPDPDDTLQIDFYNGDGTMLGTVKSAAIGEPAGGDVETQAAGIFFAVVRNTGNSNGDFTISVTKL